MNGPIIRAIRAFDHGIVAQPSAGSPIPVSGKFIFLLGIEGFTVRTLLEKSSAFIQPRHSRKGAAMRKIILTSCFWSLALAFGITGLTKAQGTVSIAGTYNVNGTNPGSGSRYHGAANIIQEGEKYRVHWAVGTVYDGIGTLKGDTFTVEWGTTTAHVGTVTYVLQKDGIMKGTWYDAKDPNTLGTEILTPIKK